MGTQAKSIECEQPFGQRSNARMSRGRRWFFFIVALSLGGMSWGMTCGGDPSSGPNNQSNLRCDGKAPIGGGGELMFPGSDCLGCHSSGKSAKKTLSVGGTLYQHKTCEVAVKGATVIIEDRQGTRLTLKTNEVGNFFSDQPLTPPLRIAVEYNGQRTEMKDDAPHGACATCHLATNETGLVYPANKP